MRRFRRRSEPEGGAVTYVRRLDVTAARLRKGRWPRDLQVVRRVLPPHLHDSPPSGAARYGLWVIAANVGRRPVGVAWAVHSAGDPTGAYIEEIAVLEAYQGRGIGVALLHEVARWMVEIDR